MEQSAPKEETPLLASPTKNRIKNIGKKIITNPTTPVAVALTAKLTQLYLPYQETPCYLDANAWFMFNVPIFIFTLIAFARVYSKYVSLG